LPTEKYCFVKKNILLIILFSYFTALAYSQNACSDVAIVPSGTVNLSNCSPTVLKAIPGFKKLTDFPPDGYTIEYSFAIGEVLYATLVNDDQTTDDLWSRDPNDGTWSPVAAFPGGPSSGGFAFAINGKGYIGVNIWPIDSPGPVTDIWEFDPTDASWNQQTYNVSFNMQFPPASFATNGKGYVSGFDFGAFYNILYEYDPVALTFEEKLLPDAVADRIGGMAFGVDGKVYAGLGVDFTTFAPKGDIYSYDPATGQSAKVADFPGGALVYASGFAIGNKGYAGLGGGSATSNSNIWEYDPATKTWALKIAFNGEPPLLPAIAATSSSLFLVGGFDLATNPINEIWEFKANAFFDSYEWTTTDGTLPAEVSLDSIVVTTPGTYQVATTATGCGASSYSVTVVPRATITGFNPAAGDASTDITIMGENFYSVTNVLIGGAPAGSWYISDANNIVATPSNGAGNDSIGVVNGCDTIWTTGFTPVCAGTGYWNGHISSDWNNPANWCGGIIPGSTDDVFIGFGANHYPVLNTPASVNNLEVDVFAEFTVADGGVLTLAGDLINDNIFPIDAYNGKIVLNGADEQVIYGDLDVKDLELDNEYGAEIDYTGYTYLYGTYTPTRGLLYTGDNLVLASTSEGTARIAAPDSTNYSPGDTYIAGGVEVDRFIPAKRAWRTLTAPLYDGGSIYDNWQNGGNTCTCGGNSGVEIFGPVTNDDNGVTPNPNSGAGAFSMRSYLDPTDEWGNVENTHDSLLTVDGATSAANKAYGVFVTGPYGSNHILSGADTTTLRAFGYLQQGDQTFNFEPNDPLLPDHYMHIGNPYAAPINLRKIELTNAQHAFWLWDPNLGGTSVGGYVTFSQDPGDSTQWDVDYTSTGQTLNLQSGATFFVAADDRTQPTAVTIKEEHKTDTLNNSVFFAPGTSNAKQLRITLSRGQSNQLTTIDGVLAKFGDAYKKGISDDVNKLFDYDENLSVKAGNAYLSITRQPLPAAGDTIQLYTYALKAKTGYAFTVNPQNLTDAADVKAWLVDSYLKTKTQVSLTEATTVAFATTGAAESSDTSRFIIVFAKAGALASINTTVKAWQQNNNVQVQWQTTGEQEVQEYVVEKSAANGQNFTALPANVAPRNSGKTEAYTITDNQPATGDNLYRIQATGKDGSRSYSNIAKVTVTAGRAFTVSPNPVAKTAQLNVTMAGMAAGRYTIQLFSADGKKILQRPVQYNGSTATQVINVPASIATGSYRLVLQDDKGNSWKQQVVIQ